MVQLSNVHPSGFHPGLRSITSILRWLVTFDKQIYQQTRAKVTECSKPSCKCWPHYTLSVLTKPLMFFFFLLFLRGSYLTGGHLLIYSLNIIYFICIIYWTNILVNPKIKIGKILHQPHVYLYSFQDCKCTKKGKKKITCTFSKCIYLLLKETATSWSIRLYGAVIILYFSRLTC